MPPAAGRVIIQAIAMFRKSDQSTAFSFFSEDDRRLATQPTKTTLPTLQCVVEIGIPIFDAISTVAAAPFSMTKPLKIKKQKHFIKGDQKKLLVICLRGWSNFC